MPAIAALTAAMTALVVSFELGGVGVVDRVGVERRLDVVQHVVRHAIEAVPVGDPFLEQVELPGFAGSEDLGDQLVQVVEFREVASAMREEERIGLGGAVDGENVGVGEPPLSYAVENSVVDPPRALMLYESLPASPSRMSEP